jgi:nitronate monooxygenase
MRTALTDLLGIELPILLSPMAGGPVTPALAAAVSNAGGLGALGLGYTAPDAIRRQIAETRALTKRPFGVTLFAPDPIRPPTERFAAANAALAPYRSRLGVEAPEGPDPRLPDFAKQLDAVIDAKVPVFSFTFNLLSDEAVSALRGAGIKIVGTATTAREARILMAAGVDAIVAQGSEAGGHRGTFNRGAADDPADTMIGTLALIPQVAAAVDVPVAAAGGIMDGRGIAAALALGAAGVQMGTAFLAAAEAGTTKAHRAALAEASDDSTAITRVFTGRRARGLRTRFMVDMEQSGATIMPYPLQIALTRPLREAAVAAGSAEFSPFFAAPGASLPRPMPAAELIRTLVREYDAARRALPGVDGN